MPTVPSSQAARPSPNSGRSCPVFDFWGKLFQVRPFVWVLNRVYDRFLRIRPRIQSIVAGRQTLRDGTFPSWLIRDLRSDHAGETGAVAIYQGILAVARTSDIRRFAEAHLKTERRHLELIETALPRKSRSVFLPLWHVAGFLTGAVPALFGRKAVFATVDAVETFVEGHYVRQIDRLSRDRTHAELRAVLERCLLDERRHRDEARHRLTRRRGIILRAWCWMVGAGSSAAVAVARVL
jgi:ubiquinone biosynthesis monooxygenase Coq7